ncbi:MAG: hypothetical protein IT450_23460, partial [Phycisphaerales bacterium]|nr:hypothetical protein [Phycisphaerales bacterium]
MARNWKRADSRRMAQSQRLTVLWLGLSSAVLLASTASAQIVNSGFDQSGGSLAGWTTFNN